MERTRAKSVLLVVGALLVGTALVVAGPAGRLLSGSNRCGNVLDCEADCTKGTAAACRRAALIYLTGDGVARSAAQGLSFLRSACKGRDAQGCTVLGATLREQAGADAEAEVLASFEAACAAGDAMGCEVLGDLYATGEGVSVDEKRARGLYETACDEGSGMACSTLAKLTADEDHERSTSLFARAAKLLRAECERSPGRACAQLGWLQEQGLGTALDVKQATASYQKACDANDGPSCFNLAATRNRVSAADPTVRPLFERACKLGMTKACAYEAEGPHAICSGMRQRGELKKGVTIADCEKTLGQ